MEMSMNNSRKMAYYILLILFSCFNLNSVLDLFIYVSYGLLFLMRPNFYWFTFSLLYIQYGGRYILKSIGLKYCMIQHTLSSALAKHFKY